MLADYNKNKKGFERGNITTPLLFWKKGLFFGNLEMYFSAGDSATQNSHDQYTVLFNQSLPATKEDGWHCKCRLFFNCKVQTRCL